jgi:hypothetical protein
VSVHLALIAESHERCDVGGSEATPQQDAGARDPRLRQKRIGGKANLPRKGTAQMELVSTSVVGKGIERHVLSDVIEEELARTSNSRSKARTKSSRGTEERCERRDGFGDSYAQREAVRRIGKHHVLQPPQRACALITRIDFVGFEMPAQWMIQRGPRFVDQTRVERNELECSRRIAPHIAVHLAWLSEAEGSGRLHVLAAVDA